ncbi:MAG: hypothetical protein JWN17_2841, partial [Frankiales bacterium]|nr:hypothetical protein [Frankiales bacterium]
TKADVVQSHLEVLMEQLLETEDLQVDDDGDIGVEHASAVWWARVRPRAGAPHIEVFSVAVTDVAPDPGLLEALNDLNGRLSHCRAFHADRKVVVAGELVGEWATLDDLVCLSGEVSSTAHREGPLLVKTFGGSVARPEHVDEEDA